ncbi:Tat protein [Mesorhizobium sp. L-8-10]|uniref:TIGR03808 family TAT-translocated repetitive protein n=1 Tax=Mesorhizobium sp. L-8-10 TaxID=2744523 RepID=UPI0019287993|nr:TIGR03808 family TAT-translocated repetitive protein [Mesorhizobium sp. L-8-10]BCH34041.1 Tat protein [Mesorhizobium sp. L-8-10]
MLNRRDLLSGTAGLAAGGLVLPASADAAATTEANSMPGAIDATTFGLHPGSHDDQSRAFANLLRTASDSDVAVFMPPGVYLVSNITLPRRVRLSGVPGATRIVYGGDGHLLLADEAEKIELTGLVFDGANRWIGDHAQGLLDFRRVDEIAMDNCRIVGSGKNGLALQHVSGRVERCTISGAAEAGIYSVEAGRLRISANTVLDCGNGGILVHRWEIGEDGTLVMGNRVERILARNGGTGQFGNGINTYRADNVVIANNSVLDCAFSAIRTNSSSNLQIVGNQAMRSGETAIYAEFAYEGAVINANIVDGAANGISMVNFNEGGRMGVCSGNIVRNLSTQGPYTADPPGFGVGIAVEADCAASGNVIENAPLFGINIGWGEFMRNVVATGNVIRKARTGIGVTVVAGVGPAIITDNMIDGAERGAIVGFEWTRQVTGDLAAEGSDAYRHLTVERNRVS